MGKLQYLPSSDMLFPEARFFSLQGGRDLLLSGVTVLDDG